MSVYRIEGLISILLLFRIECMDGGGSGVSALKGVGRMEADVPVISSGKMESRTSRSSICSS